MSPMRIPNRLCMGWEIWDSRCGASNNSSADDDKISDFSSHGVASGV